MNNNDNSSLQIHSFNKTIAKKCGILSAVIYNHIEFWIQKNEADEKHFYDGKYWTYFTLNGIQKIFDYVTVKQIRLAIDKLIKADLIETGNYNKTPYDRTLWYSLKTKIDLPKKENGILQKGTPIPDILTDILTDNTLTISNEIVSTPEKDKSIKKQTGIPMENNQSTYGEPVYLWSTGIPMENITSIPMENQTGIPMENTQKKYLKEIKKYSSVPEKSLERKPQNKESKESTVQKTERQKMFDLLVSICKIDPNIKRGHLNKTIKILMDSGYTSYDLEKFSDWWNKNDWRGVKGQPPTLGQVAEFIFRVKELPADEENEELEAYITPEGERRFRRKGTNGNS